MASARRRDYDDALALSSLLVNISQKKKEKEKEARKVV
jgi:hypothetical protein